MPGINWHVKHENLGECFGENGGARKKLAQDFVKTVGVYGSAFEFLRKG